MGSGGKKTWGKVVVDKRFRDSEFEEQTAQV